MKIKKYKDLSKLEDFDTICPKCKHHIIYLDEPEAGMGYIKCPKCNNILTQKNIISK